jgi:hypothetical protein
MKLCKLLKVLLLMNLVLVTACSVITGGIATQKSSPSSTIETLTETYLANATYRLNEFGIFKLDNGEYEHRYGEGMTQRIQVTLEKVGFGDLNDDGSGDAAVILAGQSGGSGTFKYLVAMVNSGAQVRQQASMRLGDRVQISALSIVDGKVKLETVKAGPLEPVCCPTQMQKQSFILRDAEWVENILE